MITLKLSGAVLGLDSEPLKNERGQDLKMHHVTADALAKSKGEPLKAFDLAQRLWADAQMEVDEADFETIRRAVMDAPLFPIVKVPIIRALDKARREQEEAPKTTEAPRQAKAPRD